MTCFCKENLYKTPTGPIGCLLRYWKLLTMDTCTNSSFHDVRHMHLLCALVGSECVSLFLFTTLDYEEGDTVEEAYPNSCYFQDQD